MEGFMETRMKGMGCEPMIFDRRQLVGRHMFFVGA